MSECKYFLANGQKFGKLTIISKVDGTGNKYLCRCECSNTKIVQMKDLTRGHIKSCGCMQGDRGNMVGKVCGMVTVLGFSGIVRSEKTGHTYRTWKCKCVCGNETIKTTSELRNGHSISCGCYRIEKTKEFATTHGLSKTRLYKTYTSMKARCYRPTTTYYENYGGRGIKVCDEWLESFENFKAWADKSGYADNLTIERIDNDGNYCPENCTWITKQEQDRNKRTNHPVIYKGQEMLLTDLVKLTGLAPQTIKKHEQQYNYNYDLMVKEILESPHHELGKRGKTNGRRN